MVHFILHQSVGLHLRNLPVHACENVIYTVSQKNVHILFFQ